MGTCQGELCACRASSVLCQLGHSEAKKGLEDLSVFVQERWKGDRPIAWGDALKENQLTLKIYQELFGMH